MAYVRLKKTIRKKERCNALATPIIDAWNSERLREGDRVDHLDEAPAGMRHPNAYNPEAIIRKAFEGISKSIAKDGLDGTRMGLDLLCGVAGALDLGQHQALQSEVRAMLVLKRPFVLHQYYDFIPSQGGVWGIRCLGDALREVFQKGRGGDVEVGAI